jgi:mgtE-like transporter
MWTRRAVSRETAKDAKESVVALGFSTLGVLLTGVTIGAFTDSLKDFPALLILIPPAIAMRGNIFASLGSRLGTYLHTGMLAPGRKSTLSAENVAGSFTLTFAMSLYLGVLAWIIARHLGLIGDGTGLATVLLVSFLAGVLSALVMVVFTFAVATAAFRRGWNPDNVTAPLITLAGDVTTLPFLFIAYYAVTHLASLPQMILLVGFLGATVVSFYPLRRSHPHFSEVVRESIPIFTVCGLFSSFSGSILGSQSDALFSYAALIMVLPAFLEDGGAIGGILAARFSSALHTGELAAGRIPRKVVTLFLMMHAIGMLMFALIGAFGYVIASAFDTPVNLLEMIAVSVIAGELLILVVNILAYYFSTVSFRAGLNPDNVVIPLLTSSMDFAGTVCLFSVAALLRVI